jgi:hypothetical protein
MDYEKQVSSLLYPLRITTRFLLWSNNRGDKIKEIDQGMKNTLFADYQAYQTIITQLQMEQIDLPIGVEICERLIGNIIRDIAILDEDECRIFLEYKKELGDKNKEAKEKRKQGMKEPHDSVDERNQKRLLIAEYDIPKHVELLGYIIKVAYNKGWLR